MSSVGKHAQHDLFMACIMGNKELVDSTILSGARVDVAFYKGSYPIHLATKNNHGNVVHMLISAGADIEAKNIDGMTPLHIGAIYGAFDAVGVLLDYVADDTAVTENGDTPLHVAVRAGHADIVELLTGVWKGYVDVVQPPINIRNKGGHTPLDLAKIHDWPKIEEILKNKIEEE